MKSKWNSSKCFKTELATITRKNEQNLVVEYATSEERIDYIVVLLDMSLASAFAVQRLSP